MTKKKLLDFETREKQKIKVEAKTSSLDKIVKMNENRRQWYN